MLKITLFKKYRLIGLLAGLIALLIVIALMLMAEDASIHDLKEWFSHINGFSGQVNEAYRIAQESEYYNTLLTIVLAVCVSLCVSYIYVRYKKAANWTMVIEEFSGNGGNDLKQLMDNMRDMSKFLKAMEDGQLRQKSCWSTINSLMEYPKMNSGFEEQLRIALQAMLSVVWENEAFAPESKGAIFLVDETEKRIFLVAEYNLPDDLREKYKTVPFGACLCGMTGQSCRTMLAMNVDKRHIAGHDNVEHQGHICVPMARNGKVLGIISIYTNPLKPPDDATRVFVDMMAQTLTWILERRQINETYQHLAQHDKLTNLPNRVLFREYFDKAIINARQHDLILAVMFLDLDKFRWVNDNLGHDAGDNLLLEISHRITSSFRTRNPDNEDMTYGESRRTHDIISRFGGDEFVILLGDIGKPEYAGLAASRIINTIKKPFNYKDQEVRIGISIGIALFPKDGSDYGTLMHKADAAMYRAKENMKVFYSYYS
ncbi:hypothetical protein CCP4SC76_2020014 [Gammaproteobacteria bacterium]